MADRIATDHIIDIRTTLRYLGVKVDKPSYLFGDNQSVITSSTIPHSSFNKCHNALSYHRVREAIAADIIKFYHIDGTKNPADVLSKHAGYPQAYPLVQPMLFWLGEPRKSPCSIAVQVEGDCHNLTSPKPSQDFTGPKHS